MENPDDEPRSYSMAPCGCFWVTEGERLVERTPCFGHALHDAGLMLMEAAKAWERERCRAEQTEETDQGREAVAAISDFRWSVDLGDGPNSARAEFSMIVSGDWRSEVERRLEGMQPINGSARLLWSEHVEPGTLVGRYVGDPNAVEAIMHEISRLQRTLGAP